VSDATAASDTAQKIGLFLSLDGAIASNTEKHCSCKQIISDYRYSAMLLSVTGNVHALRALEENKRIKNMFWYLNRSWMCQVAKIARF
jgi:hypothetical protein